MPITVFYPAPRRRPRRASRRRHLRPPGVAAARGGREGGRPPGRSTMSAYADLAARRPRRRPVSARALQPRLRRLPPAVDVPHDPPRVVGLRRRGGRASLPQPHRGVRRPRPLSPGCRDDRSPDVGQLSARSTWSQAASDGVDGPARRTRGRHRRGSARWGTRSEGSRCSAPPRPTRASSATSRSRSRSAARSSSRRPRRRLPRATTGQAVAAHRRHRRRDRSSPPRRRRVRRAARRRSGWRSSTA